MKLTPLFFGILSFLGGVFISDLFREYWVLNLIFIFFLLPVVIKKYSQNIIQRDYVLWVVTGMFCFFLGSIRLFFSLSHEENKMTHYVKDKEITITGTIVNFPKQKINKTVLTVLVDTIEENTTTERKKSKIKNKKINEKILVNIFQTNTSFEYGNQVKISGKLRKPEKIGKFDYARFLEKEGIFTYFSSARGTIISSSPPTTEKKNIFWQKIFRYRQKFEDSIRSKLPFLESEYAIGILLGAESGIPKNILEEFNDTGLRHLLALSGFNITILILIVFSVLFFLPKWIQIICTLCIISFFVLLTGASSSVVRAAIMGGLGMIVLHSGRGNRDNVPLLLLITLLGMTIWNPFVLVSDTSLQFSVLAVLGLFILVPFFQKTFTSDQKKLSVWKEILFATVSAQIFTLPLQLVLFENFSIIAPLANLIVAPITSFAMLFSFFVSIPYLGWICVPFAYILLHFSLGIAHLFSQIPFSHISTQGLPMWSLFPLFGIILLISFYSTKKINS